MKYKKSIIILVLAIFLFSVGSVCASDANDTAIELSQADADEIVSVEETELISLTENEEITSERNVGTFSELQNNITEKYGSTLILTKDYEHGDDFESNGIIINQSITIDGQGHKIDAQGKSRIFKITVDNVVLKNINFINGNTTMEGGAVHFEKSGTVSDCNFTNNKATYIAAFGGAIYMDSGSVTNCNFVNNYAEHNGGSVYFRNDGVMSNCTFTGNTAIWGGAAYFDSSSYVSVVDCNFINNTATGDGGAIHMGSGSIKNCNFTDNAADYGGAVYSDESMGIETINSNFINNSASKLGGAVYVYNEYNLTDCNFTTNLASGDGGAIYIDSGSVTNCNFTNNSANYGGAVYVYSNGEMTNCNFADNTANRSGGAVYFKENGTVTNCNFINNTAENHGGAIYFNNTDTVENCNFSDNTATNGNGGAVWIRLGSFENCYFTNNNASNRGGAIYFLDEGTITKCNFSDNKASGRGGAAYFYIGGTVDNCNFANHTASNDGGALYIYDMSTVKNCNFINNTASRYGGAIYFNNNSNVENCDFTDNTASNSGAAIYLNSEGFVENCNFSDNTATNGNGGAVWIKSGGFEDCYFTNNNASNRGGAIYFLDEGTITKCNFSDNKASGRGGAAYFYMGGTVDNCNFANHTGSNDGGALFIYDMSTVKNCNFINNTASEWGGAIRMSSGSVENCNFTNNKADGNKGQGGAINSANGELTISNSKFTANAASLYGGAVYLNNESNVINCNFSNNAAIVHGGAIDINYGNIDNCNFNNNTITTMGGAIYSYAQINITNCNFTDNTAMGDKKYGGAIAMSSGSVENCNFANNSAYYAGAIWFDKEGNVTNCNFINNKATGATSWGGAIRMDSGNVTNCNFTNNSATYRGGAIFFSGTKYSGHVENCNFNSNSGRLKGGAIYFSSTASPSITINCNFADNTASDSNGNGGAVLMYSGSVENCSFYCNTAGLRGGAVYFDRAGNITNCNFANNKASYSTGNGGAAYFYNKGKVTDCIFTDNSATNRGGAIYFETACDLTNCNFTGNNATTGSAIYLYSTSATKTIYNSTFLNNRANSEDLEVTKNENNITIAFSGKDNLLNAIYSNGDVTFTNVTYWGADGINNTGNAPNIIPISKYEAGQNLSISVLVDNILILNTTKITDNKGKVVVDDIVAGNCIISVASVTDAYYSYIETVKVYQIPGESSNLILETLENKLIANVASGAVGNVTFTVKNESGILKTVNMALNESATELDLSDLDYGRYVIDAVYLGNINYRPSQDSIIYQMKAPSSITVNVNSSYKVGEEIPVSVDIPGATGNVSVIVDGVETVVPLVDGKANYTIPALDVGGHSVLISYAGDATHAFAAVAKSISVSASKSEFADITVSGDGVISLSLVDETGLPIANADVTYTINGKAYAGVTDSKGIVIINVSANSVVELKYTGTHTILPANTTITLKDLTKTRMATTILGNNYTQYAIEYDSGERGQNFTVQVVDANGAPIANKTVLIGYNGKTLYRTTDTNGYASVQINLRDKNRLTFAVTFLGDEDYNATMSVYLITIKQKPVTITASAKTYKASAKTKKYTVTLKTIKGASADGKTYFAADKKVTLKVNGKTYTAKTNAEGQATFSLKITKKGKYTAIIKYAGDTTYSSASKTVKYITIK